MVVAEKPKLVSMPFVIVYILSCSPYIHSHVMHVMAHHAESRSNVTITTTIQPRATASWDNRELKEFLRNEARRSGYSEGQVRQALTAALKRV